MDCLKDIVRYGLGLDEEHTVDLSAEHSLVNATYGVLGYDSLFYSNVTVSGVALKFTIKESGRGSIPMRAHVPGKGYYDFSVKTSTSTDDTDLTLHQEVGTDIQIS